MARTDLTVNLNHILGSPLVGVPVEVKLSSEAQIAFLDEDMNTTIPIYSWTGTTDASGEVVLEDIPATEDYLQRAGYNDGQYTVTVVIPDTVGLPRVQTYTETFTKTDANSTLRGELLKEFAIFDNTLEYRGFIVASSEPQYAVEFDVWINPSNNEIRMLISGT